MHLQRNTEGQETLTHTGEGGRGGYRTAKAEAKTVSTEVHGNMEHCPDIVDSSVVGAEPDLGHICWEIIPLMNPLVLLFPSHRLHKSPADLCVCVCV